MTRPLDKFRARHLSCTPLLEIIAGQAVLAYSAGFDHAVISQHAGRDGLDPACLGDIGHWSCLMIRRSD